MENTYYASDYKAKELTKYLKAQELLGKYGGWFTQFGLLVSLVLICVWFYDNEFLVKYKTLHTYSVITYTCMVTVLHIVYQVLKTRIRKIYSDRAKYYTERHR